MTQLPSKDSRVVIASIRSIERMDREMAFDLADIFYYSGGLNAIIGWSDSSDVELANRASKILELLKENSPLQAKKLYERGMSREEVVRTMGAIYKKQSGVTNAQVEQYEKGIDILLRYQRQK